MSLSCLLTWSPGPIHLSDEAEPSGHTPAQDTSAPHSSVVDSEDHSELGTMMQRAPGEGVAADRTVPRGHPPPLPTPEQSPRSLTRVQLLGGCAELCIFGDSVGNIGALGGSSRGTKPSGLGDSIRQGVEVQDL